MMELGTKIEGNWKLWEFSLKFEIDSSLKDSLLNVERLTSYFIYYNLHLQLHYITPARGEEVRVADRGERERELNL